MYKFFSIICFIVILLISINIFDLGKPSNEIREYTLYNRRENCSRGHTVDFPYEEILFETTYKAFVEDNYIIEDSTSTKLNKNNQIKEYSNGYRKNSAIIKDDKNWQYTIQFEGKDAYSVRRSGNNVRTVYYNNNKEKEIIDKCSRELNRFEYLKIQCDSNFLCWILGNRIYSIPSKPFPPMESYFP